MVETFKSINHLNPEIMWNSFEIINIAYSLRNSILLRLPPSNTSTYGINSFTFRACVLWNTIPDCIKKSSSIKIFSNELRKWKNLKCTCKICRQ